MKAQQVRQQQPALREAQAHRQEADRTALEKKMEDAQKIGYWREDRPERAAQQRAEPGEQREQGRGLGR
jgi:hypothetical protein